MLCPLEVLHQVGSRRPKIESPFVEMKKMSAISVDPPVDIPVRKTAPGRLQLFFKTQCTEIVVLMPSVER